MAPIRSSPLVPSLALALAGLVACDVTSVDVQPTATDQGSKALVNGTATNARPEIGEFSRGCTATLIHPRYILTAAHCSDYSNTVRTGDAFTFVDRNGTNRSYAVTRINVFGPHVAPSGSLLFANSLPAGTGNNDVAIMQLRDPVPGNQALPALIADTQPGANARVTQFGFGCTVRSPRTNGIAGKQFISWNFGTTTTNICPGDSGGPAVFGERDGNGPIWAINSGHEGGTQATAADIFANVVWFKEAILDVIRGWEGTRDEVGINRPGGDLRGVDVASDPNACRTLCEAEPACVAFSYVNPGIQGPSAKCWLKNAIPGWIPDGNATSSVALTTEPGVNRFGTDIAGIDLPSAQPELCASACATNRSCASFSYIKPGVQGTSARCWLKGGIPEMGADGNTTSGVKRGVEVGFDRPGADLRSSIVADLEACKRACSIEPACKAFSFAGSTSRCFLKNGIAAAVPAAGLTSGVKKGLEMNVNRFGGDLRGLDLNTGSPEECQAECEKDSACKAFTYVSQGLQGNRPRCWLKSSVSAPGSEAGTVSGLKGMTFF